MSSSRPDAAASTPAGRNPSRLQPLGAAVVARLAESVRTLLAAGANVDEIGPLNRTPLMLAAERGDLEMVKLLLTAGAKLAARDFQNWTALHLACSRRRAAVVRLLLSAGADPALEGPLLLTPLQVVIQSSELPEPESLKESVAALLERGADPGAPSFLLPAPLELAARRGFDQTVDLFLASHGSLLATAARSAAAAAAAATGHELLARRIKELASETGP